MDVISNITWWQWLIIIFILIEIWGYVEKRPQLLIIDKNRNSGKYLLSMGKNEITKYCDDIFKAKRFHYYSISKYICLDKLKDETGSITWEFKRVQIPTTKVKSISRISREGILRLLKRK